jgi:hypothetical protein
MKKPPRSYESLPHRDIGQKALDKTWADLQIDPEWSVREPHAFTWWGSRFATRVWAEPEVDDDGFQITRLRAETDFVRGARTDAGSDLFLATIGRYASLSGIVRDAADPATLKLHTSVFVHPDTATQYLRIFQPAVVLQAEAAYRTAALVAKNVGGTPAVSPHPASGFRESPDELLALPRLLVEQGGDSSAWKGPELEHLAELFQRPPCLMANGDEEGLTAEFPFLGGSSLLTLVTTEPHPALGSGLLMLLRIPGGGPPAECASLAVRLNALEKKQFTRTHFAGSWCSDDGGAAYVSFVPNLVHANGLLTNLASSMVVRARWVAEKVFHDDWTRTRATSAFERLVHPEAAS